MTTKDKLAVFAARVREMYDAIRVAGSREAERLGAEMAAFVEQQTEALMAEGLSIMKIEKALLGVIDAAEQTYAPDAEGDDDESMDSLFMNIAYFLPLEETVVEAYRNGLSDADEMMARVLEKSEDMTPVVLPEILELILNDIGRQKIPDNLTGGEAVCDVGGEVFIPEYLKVSDPDGGYHHIIWDSMVFKTAEEVRTLSAFLKTVNKKTFYQRAKITQATKAGRCDSDNTQVPEKEMESFIGIVWEEFSGFRTICRKAAEQKKGLAVFRGQMGPGEDYDYDYDFDDDDDEMIDDEPDDFDDESER